MIMRHLIWIYPGNPIQIDHDSSTALRKNERPQSLHCRKIEWNANKNGKAIIYWGDLNIFVCKEKFWLWSQKKKKGQLRPCWKHVKLSVTSTLQVITVEISFDARLENSILLFSISYIICKFFLGTGCVHDDWTTDWETVLQIQVSNEKLRTP